MTPLPYLSVLQVAGPDAGKFLQAQLSAQLGDLEAPTASFAAYCTAKGQVIATMLVAPRGDDWLLLMESSLLEKVTGRLRQFVMRDKVELHPRTDQYVFAVNPGDILLPGLVLLEPRSIPVQYGISDMEPQPDSEVSARWRRSELLFGIPWLDLTHSEKYIPQMLGLDTIGAVSFSKGCYPGQEIIARARHLGEVKRRPLVLDLDGSRAPDTDSPCFIRSMGREVEAGLVHCVATSSNRFTVFAVAALKADEPVRALEQDGHLWTATRVANAHSA